MTVGELIERLQSIPKHYVVKIWDENNEPEYWTDKITGKLLAEDQVAIIPEKE